MSELSEGDKVKFTERKVYAENPQEVTAVVTTVPPYSRRRDGVAVKETEKYEVAVQFTVEDGESHTVYYHKSPEALEVVSDDQ